MAGWPAYDVMFPIRNPGMPRLHALLFFILPYVVQVARPKLHFRPMGREELPRAHSKSSSVQGTWRPPRQAPPFGSLKIPDFRAKTGQRNWRIGVRLGYFAGGGEADRMQPPTPALSRAGVLEILDAVSAPGQVECPPPMNTDACLCYVVMRYPSSEVALTWCDVGRSVVVR